MDIGHGRFLKKGRAINFGPWLHIGSVRENVKKFARLCCRARGNACLSKDLAA
jgi:hypothetical protein